MPTAAPLANMTRRTCRSVAPIAPIMPRARIRRWAITVNPATESSPTNVSPIVASSRTARACCRRCCAALVPVAMMPWTVPAPVGGWKDVTALPPASKSSDMLDGVAISPGATRPNASCRSLGFSTMPTTRSGRPFTDQAEPIFRPNVVATVAVTAASCGPDRVAARDQAQHGLAERAVRVLGAQVDRGDRPRHRHALMRDRFDGAE